MAHPRVLSVAERTERTRLGRIVIETSDDPPLFIVTVSGYVGIQLVQRDLRIAEEYADGHPGGWVYIVDMSHGVLPSPLNVLHLRRLKTLPNIRGYLIVLPKSIGMRAAIRIGQGLTKPDGLFRTKDEALDAAKALLQR